MADKLETVRLKLRELILKDVPSLDNVWEPSVAGPSLKTPYAVVRKSSDVPQMEKYAGVLHHYEVWPHVDRKTLNALDSLAQQIQKSLSDRVFFVGQIPYYVEYDGSSTEDMIIEDWDLLTRSLSFKVHELDWLTHVAVDPDPVDAMRRWTENKTNYQHDPTTWEPTADIPALYWRLAETINIETTNWGAWHTVLLNGHIISPDDRQRKEAVEKIANQLGLDLRTKMSDGSQMMFMRVSADNGYDAFGNGQIRLEARFGRLRHVIRRPIKRVYFTNDYVKGDVIDDTTKNKD